MSSVLSRGLALVAVLAIAMSILVASPQPADALSGSEFNPGYIISDTLFYDAKAMSEAQIQTFLVAKGSGLSTYRSDVASRSRLVSSSTGNVRCEAFPGGTNLLASTIIYQAQTACGISAKVILVTLQKEQGLIGRAELSSAALDRAMGYACPDTAPCASTPLGFGNQVYSGTLQLNTYRAAKFAMQPGVRSIQYHPNSACGASSVNVLNYGTAALYSYTPYQPNASALANLYGTGDACGSYGNRNFWVYYSNWFGSPVGLVNPIGVVDSLTGIPGHVHVTGWVFDPDTKSPIDVHVYVNGVGAAYQTDISRPDVDSAYGGVGALHGYDITIPVTVSGTQEVCVYGINSGPGTNILLACRTVTAFTGSPTLVVDSVSTADGAITTSGWVFDPDSADPVQVRVEIDGTATTVLASNSRPDVAAAYPGYGPYHGYSLTINATPGSHSVCVEGINVGPGGNTKAPCRQVTVPAPPGTFPELGRAPFGVVDSVTAGVGSVSVSGWAIDPDTAASIRVHIYVDSSGLNAAADKPRADVAAAYPGYGPDHAYSETIATSPGQHRVCAYGINAGPGPSSTLLACRQVTVR